MFRYVKKLYGKAYFYFLAVQRKTMYYSQDIKIFGEKAKKIMKKTKKCSIICGTWECQGFDRVKRLLSAGKQEL